MPFPQPALGAAVLACRSSVAGQLVHVRRQVATTTAARARPAALAASSNASRSTPPSRPVDARFAQLCLIASEQAASSGSRWPLRASSLSSTALPVRRRSLGLARSYAAHSTPAGKQPVPPPPRSSELSSVQTDLLLLEPEPVVEDLEKPAQEPPQEPLRTLIPTARIDPESLPFYDYRTFPQGVLPEDRPTVLLTSDAALADAVVPYLGSIVGLDIEWTPQYIKGGGTNPMALLQISDGQTILILQVFSWGKDCPPNLRAFLENPKILKLGVGILPDGKKIHTDLGVECAGLRELSSFVPSQGRVMGLAAFAARYLGLQLPKSKKVILSNWAATQLSAAQVAYAANDVQSAVHIYTAMRQAALEQNQSHKKGWNWEARSSEVQTGHPRVPQELVDEIQVAVRVAGSTPSSRPAFMPADKRPSRGTTTVPGLKGSYQRSLARSTAGRDVIDSLTGGRFDR